MKTMVTVAVVGILTGCRAGGDSGGQSTNVTTYRDEQNRVTCYIVRPRFSDGIAMSCVADAMLKAREGK